MEIVTFKIQEDILNKIDNILKSLNFSNRTEFIRECIREKLNQIEEKDIFIKTLENFKGSAKTTVSDKRLREIREEVFKKYEKKFGI